MLRVSRTGEPGSFLGEIPAVSNADADNDRAVTGTAGSQATGALYEDTNSIGVAVIDMQRVLAAAHPSNTFPQSRRTRIKN